MTGEDPRIWLWEHCEGLRAKPRSALSRSERELLEYEEFENRLMGEGSGAYYIDSTPVCPSLLASLFTRIGPESIAKIVRDLALLHPDDMPQDTAEREAYLTRRYDGMESLGLAFETQLFANDPFELIDNYVSENLASIHSLLRRLEHGDA
jgi:hypothetical protein